jgi:hypothetical protein
MVVTLIELIRLFLHIGNACNLAPLDPRNNQHLIFINGVRSFPSSVPIFHVRTHHLVSVLTPAVSACGVVGLPMVMTVRKAMT